MTVDVRGRVMIPKEVRERLGLRAGARVTLAEVDGALTITPVATPMTVVELDGIVVLETPETIPTLTAEQVRAVQDVTRR